MASSTIKGPTSSDKHFDGSPLRIAIVHTRWNTSVITSLVDGARSALISAGVQPANITIQDVPGAWELPLGVQRVYAASQIQSSSLGGGGGSLSAGDLLGGAGGSSTDLTASATGAGTAAFDAVIAIGCLIKGHTMHFEYIADATSHGLMRVQLDSGVPLVFGLLTVLEEGQALERAGLQADKDGRKKNAGEEWGEAAVELGVKRREWGAGKFV